jgi:cell wall-associated NlpC family hydrolase
MSCPAPCDARTHAFRPDLADIALSHTVIADRFVEPVLRQCVRGVVPLLAEPLADARQVSQIRYGEFIDIFETRLDGFAWVQNRTDRYVGYMPMHNELNEDIADLSWRVGALRTFVYSEPDLKTPPVDELTLGSYVRLGGSVGGFRKLTSGGYVFAKHIFAAGDARVTDYVFTAGRLLAVPYLWGGRTPQGIDCSGLVQLALDMAGYDCPRDSDQQSELFGLPLQDHWRDHAWKRGDLVFFANHAGVMTGPDHIIHASASDMSVVVETLYDLVMRGNEIQAMGRP